jgi:hypothetical protein
MSGIRLTVTHTGLAGTSLLIADIEDGTDGPNRKSGPVYIPQGGTISLIYDTMVAKSYSSGVLRGFVNGGHITAQLWADDDYQEAVGTRIDKIVRVAPNPVQGDYTSVKAACDAETTPGTLILLMPGTYSEDPFTLAPDVHIDSWSVDLATVNAKATIPNTDLVTLGARATLRQINIGCPLNAWGCVADGTDALLESVVFLSGYGAAHAINGGTLYIRQGLVNSGVLYGVRAETNSFAGFHGTVNRASLRALEAIGAGSRAVFSSVVIEGTGDAFYVASGGNLLGQGAYVDLFTTALCRTGLGGGTIDIGGVSRIHAVPSALDVWQEDANGVIVLRGVSLDAERVVAEDYSKISGYGNRSGAGIDPALTIWSALHVGTPGIGRELVTGQGDVTNLGLRAFTYDGVSFVDVTETAKTRGAPLTVFPNTNANTALYLGWQLDGGFQFHGVEFDVISQVISLGAGSVRAEYWNGAAWVAFTFMVTEEEFPYTPQAMDVWQNFNGGEHLRFDASITTTWTKNDPIVPALGENLFWIRFRIHAPITTSPVIDLIKLAPTRTRFSEDGIREMDGLARLRKLIPWRLEDFKKVAGFGDLPADQDVWVSQNIAAAYVNNNFRGGADCRTTRYSSLPTDLDTSTPIHILWKWCPSTALAGDIEWTITWTYLPHGSTVSFVNPGVPHPNEKTIQVVTPAPGVLRQCTDSMFILDVSGARSRVPGGHGDILYVTVRRNAGAGADTYAGNAVVLDLEATYLSYTD